jgi:hypothetical protein
VVDSRALRRIRHYAVRVLVPILILDLFVAGPDATVLHVLGWVLFGVAGTTVATLWWRLGARRWWIFGGAKRTAELLAWYRDLELRAQAPGIELIRVARITQHAARGTKAIVQHSDGGTQDAWFWRIRVSRGDVMLVRGHTGYGPHTRGDHVLYIGTKETGNGVVGTIPRSVWRAGHRRQV